MKLLKSFQEIDFFYCNTRCKGNFSFLSLFKGENRFFPSFYSLTMLYSTLIIVGLLFVQANAHVIDKRQQKDAVKTSKLPKLKPLAWGDVNFIHSTDTHGNKRKKKKHKLHIVTWT